ncbi:MAG TPA: tetratricopeptide repeat protein, partial [Dyella sp.]
MNPRLQGLGPAATQHVMIAGQALDAGRVAEADQHLSAALAAYPDHPEVLRMKAGVHSLRGEHKDAIRVMQRALTQRPQDPLYYNTM